MESTTIILLVVMLGVAIFLFARDNKFKLTYKGRSQLKLVVPTMIAVFVVVSVTSKTIKPSDFILLAAMIPLALFGNKCGLTDEGIVSNSYLTTWDKLEEFEIIKQNNKYVLQYKSNIGYRKVYFSEEIGEKVEETLSNNRKIRHRRKK